MDSFALSERWNGWENLDVMVQAARAAVAAGPFEPLLCEITLEGDDDVATLGSLDELQVLLDAGEDPLGIEILIAQEPESDASLVLVYNGRWLQINGYGNDWQCARQAYDAARIELVVEYGITTFKLPKLPYDTVAETRRRLEKQELNEPQE